MPLFHNAIARRQDPLPRLAIGNTHKHNPSDAR